MHTQRAFRSNYHPRRAAPVAPTHLHTINPLSTSESSPEHRLLATPDPSSIHILWSGWLGQPSYSADGQVDPDFRAWSGPGRQELDAILADVLPSFAAAMAHLWIRPHARHILSDAPSCAAFLRDHAAACTTRALGLFLDLDLLLTNEMAPRRTEHAERILSRLLPLDGIAAIAMTRADWLGDAGTLAGTLAPAALHLIRADESLTQ